MKKLKLSDKKLWVMLNSASSSGRRSLVSAARSDDSQKSANLSSSTSTKLKQEAESSFRLSGIFNSTTNSIYQEYNKYYSYITSTLTASSSNPSSSSSSPSSSSTTNTPPNPTRRLDLHEIIVKPLMDLTASAAAAAADAISTSNQDQPARKSSITPTPNPIRVQTEMKLNNEARLVELVDGLQRATSLLIKSEIVADLFKLLYAAPELRFAVDKRRLPLIRQLVELRQLNDTYALKRKEDKRLAANLNQCLALLGYVDESAIKHAGLNILTLDGGGAKGFVAIEILKNIERHCNKPIHQIFDYICGTSTGACIAALIAIYKISLDEIERQYKIFIKEIFQRNRAAGIGNLVMSYAYYDTQVWEKMLKEAMGDTLMINSAKDPNSCKISIVSNMTTANQMKIFLFRNYNLPTSSQSHYEGTCRYKVWEAIRASTAAPIYHEDFKLDGFLFYDGGVLANNPTPIALHEARHLWPSHKQPNCVVSIGNGRFQPALDDSPSFTSSSTTTSSSVSNQVAAAAASAFASASSVSSDLSLRQKVNRIVAGVGSTETVHNMLIDLLPASVYYRFNPYLSEEFSLDENRPNKWKLMQYETSMYMRRNKSKFEMAAKKLCKEKSAWQKLEDVLRKKIK